MLDSITNRFSQLVKTMRGQTRLTEANMADMLREIRLALLEADVALPVVRAFVEQVKQQAVGKAVHDALSPGQALVGVVQQELARLMGADLSAEEKALNLATQDPAIILMAGLQGAGKTTTVGKLAQYLREKKKRVLTVSADIYRPAAITQLQTVTSQAGADFFASTAQQTIPEIAQAALNHAKKYSYDILLVDSAGRLAIDQAMMDEIRLLHKELNPIETLFVVDSMLGQDAMNTAKAFQEALPLTGIVLTKLDGDARGGAVLSVRHIVGKPVKFVGTAEKLDGLEAFDPERMANRILGMGDILALLEQTQKNVDQEEAQKLAQKIKSGQDFDLNDYKSQLMQMRKMGGVSAMLDKLPNQMQQMAKASNIDQAEKEMKRAGGIIDSMTPLERRKPDVLKASRKRRIAAGAGVSVQEVNRLLNQYSQMHAMMKKMKGGGLMKMMRTMKGMF